MLLFCREGLFRSVGCGPKNLWGESYAFGANPEAVTFIYNMMPCAVATTARKDQLVMW